MSALARWFRYNGFWVEGYDKTSTALTSALINEGIKVHFDDEIENIPEPVLRNIDKTLVIFTPAIPGDHKEYIFLKQEGFLIKKRSEVLGLITSQMKTIAIAGTHGKTTTSSMTAHILKYGGVDCAAFLGGIAKNFNSNLLINRELNSETIVVVEADEFDRSFLTLNPEIAVITSADADHLDIYQNKYAVEESFQDFAAKVSGNGTLIVKSDFSESLFQKVKGSVRKFTYALDEGDFYTRNIRIENARFYFDVCIEGHWIENVALLVPGFHNIENAIAAMAVGMKLGVKPSVVKEAIETYEGVKRRFDYILKTDQKIYVDDYAHHPAEVEAFLKSVKALYKSRKVTAVFQPHLYSRTRDFAREFAESLSLADEVILLDIYPAREKPIEGVSSDIIFKGITSAEKILCTKENLLEVLEQKKKEIQVLVSMGAGDIDQLVSSIKETIA